MGYYSNSRHFVNCVLKMTRNKGFDTVSHVKGYTEIYRKYENNDSKLDDFTYCIVNATNNSRDVGKLVKEMLAGFESKKKLRSSSGATSDYMKLYYSDSQKKHFGHLWNEPGLYRLHDESGLVVYVGKSVNLAGRIPQSMAERKTFRYSYSVFSSVADMHVYEMYYIAKWKPELNKEAKTDHVLSITLPDVEFNEPILFEEGESIE